ncbi:MAG: FAD-binding oxidoreductase [Rhizobiales bacterium]|nr:FAD-binding oxidoreductase [Hyphomicrobiales bacterium]
MSLPGPFTEDFKSTPYWWEAAEPTPVQAPDLPTNIDVAVVGGGYTGLSCALELARQGVKVAVVEAERIGFQASSRNGGMVTGGLKLAQGAMSSQLGQDRAAAILKEAIGTLDFIEMLIEREGIACHFRRTGRFTCAYSRRDYDALAARTDQIAELTGGAAYMLPPSRQREEIGSDHYRGGMVVKASGALHPSLYLRGLATAAARAGATLIDGTRATGFERQANGWRIKTERGDITARDVMVGTNGYTGPATPWLRRRVVPVASFIIATEELPADLTKRLVPNGRMLADTRRVLSYFRLSPDGKRVLWGGRVGTSAMEARKSALRLRAMMCRVWPELADARLTHSWNGNVAFTFDYLPHLGVHNGMHYAMGCQGNGVAMQTWLGYQAALMIAGGKNAPSAFSGLPFPTKPLYNGAPWFLPAVLAWYKLRDSIDRLSS